MCLGFVRSYGSFVAVRAILGMTEGGLLPGMVLYLSGLYTRGELALRIGIFYTAASLSGAFGGLLARGLSAIGPRGGLEGWRWIFVCEGLLLPTIIGDMHIASNSNEVQLWSVIPYAVATPVTVLVAFLSDRLRLRGLLMLCVLPISIAGYAAIANVTAPKTRFAMTCLMAIGMYSAVPCVLVWNSNNSAGHYKRATTSALQLAIANCGGFVATFIYPSSEGPYYHKGHTVILGLLCYAWVATLLNVLWCAKINRDKAAGKYDEFAGTGDDREPGFKMVL
ncbi:major facilitator superfamily transporter [Colletotrichum tofieldiae]|nr:major facilitator superfamily transporter [Colletotrichum tofieldiae]